jgi:hypothetical protein
LGDVAAPEIHIRRTSGTTVTNLANVAASNIRTTNANDRRNVEIRHQTNKLQVLLNDVLLVDITNPGLSGLLNGNRAFVGFTAATGVEGDDHNVFSWTMTNVVNPSSPTPTPGITCLIPIPIIGPILCFILDLIF